uniref:BRCT domain-containing protein n=1 Tax=Panagrolaimus sp. ES5 TaxID=591445 RepID=A0AC34F4Y5_9BILA
MGPRISDDELLPEVITIDSDNCSSDEEKKNLEDGDEYEVDAISFIWKSELKRISAENNVISHKQVYKSCSSVIHAAIDSYSKDKKRKVVNNRSVKAVKDLTEEQVLKELKELDARRAELLKALETFAKKKESNSKGPQRSSFFSTKSSLQNGGRRSNENGKATSDTDQSLSLGRQTPRIPKTPLNDITNENQAVTYGTKKSHTGRMSMGTPTSKKISLSPRQRMHSRMSTVTKSPYKPFGETPHKILRSQVDCDGELTQQLRVTQDFEDPDDIEPMDLDDVVNLEEEEQSEERIVVDIPYCKDYDPANFGGPHDVAFVVNEVRERFKSLYYQPDLPDNQVKIPSLASTSKLNSFYLFEVPEEKREGIVKQIKNLGGTVTSRLYNATKIIFFPNNKQMSDQSLFTFLTAAVGGRYILPFSYISDSIDAQMFLDAKNFCTMEYYESKYDLHRTTVSAIKISNNYRNQYSRKQYPRFHRHNVLLAVPKRQDEDVKVLLQILGAYVQPCYDNKIVLKNPLYTLCINDGKVKLAEEAKLIPRVTPDKIREMLWNTLNTFQE